MAQFTNQATVSYNGVTVNSNIVTGEITQVINVWKNSTIDKYRVGDILTYVVSIRNSGAADYTGLTIRDDLGAYTFQTDTLVPLTFTEDPVLHYVNGSLQATPTVQSGPPLVISGISVPAGLSAELIYRVRVNEYAALDADAMIENTAVVSGNGLSELIAAKEIVVADPDPSLSIMKELNPTTVVENGQIVYTFTIHNMGPTAADAAVQTMIADTFSPALNDPINVTLNGTVWSQAGNYTYDETTGEFATVPGMITVPAATHLQDTKTGAWRTTPGVTVLTVSGTI